MGQLLTIHYTQDSKIDFVHLSADLTLSPKHPQVRLDRQLLGRLPSIYLLKSHSNEFDLTPDLL